MGEVGRGCEGSDIAALPEPPVCALCAGVPRSLLWWGGPGLLAHLTAPSGVSSPPFPLCPQVSLLALPRATTGPTLGLAALGQPGREAGAAEGHSASPGE